MTDAPPNWLGLLPRMLAHGVDHNDFVRTTASVRSWPEWLDAWVATGDAHRALADEAAAHERPHTAGDAYVRAALCYHFAKFQWPEDPKRYRATSELTVATHGRGMRLIDRTFERLVIPFERAAIFANLRRPADVARPAVIVLVPGMDSAKEEFPHWEDAFLARGMATASLDGPGQGEAGYRLPMRPDYEVAVGALLDVLQSRIDLDLGRVGITGMGLGGYYASRAAAFEPRIRAAGVVGGAYQFPKMPPQAKRMFMHGAHLSDEDAARTFAAQFTLEGVTPLIAGPYLVIHGQNDAVMAWRDAERTTSVAPRGEFRLYPEGNTVCQSVSHLFKPFLADWLKERLGDAENGPRG